MGTWSLRLFLVALITWFACAHADAAQPVFAEVDPNEALVFPRDHGAHPDYRTEWWYVTGWLRTAEGEDVGFQVTFFRARVPTDEANPSRFAPKQMVFAHAALADRKVGRLIRDQRISRTGFGYAEVSAKDADVKVDRWRFVRVPEDADPNALHFRTTIRSDRFDIDLDLRTTEPVLAQGADAAHPGYSQKGPAPREASHYYSVPRLDVTGTVARPGAPPDTALKRTTVRGTAWLDREWSSAYLNPQATGWDWVGLNLDDGGALMVFQMRDHRGGELWAGGARRFPDGRVERYGPDDIKFTTQRIWTSPMSGALWPVSQSIAIGRANPDGSKPASGPTPLTIVVEPMMDNQELDARGTTGTIYWEGAVRARADDLRRTPLGRGYLELTGYWRPIKF